jgi:DeoD family purine-nucleoside phosphorylase
MEDTEMIPTPHIEAAIGDFAETVLMPGDPLRAKFIAETFLTDARLVNGVRGICGYTALYKGKPVSVMASGMGMPSIGIYSYELFAFYGVKNIIRVGTAGGMNERVKLRDLVLGISASTDSNYAAQFRLPGTFAPTADFTLLRLAAEEAAIAEIPALERRAGTLNTLARIAPLVGLAGTVFALLRAFLHMTAAGHYATADLFSADIAQALAATGLGLIIAIVLQLGHHFISGRIRALTYDIDKTAIAVIRFLNYEIHLPESDSEASPEQ